MSKILLPGLLLSAAVVIPATTRAAERAQAAARGLPGLEDLAAQLRQTVLDLH